MLEAVIHMRTAHAESVWQSSCLGNLWDRVGQDRSSILRQHPQRQACTHSLVGDLPNESLTIRSTLDNRMHLHRVDYCKSATSSSWPAFDFTIRSLYLQDFKCIAQYQVPETMSSEEKMGLIFGKQPRADQFESFSGI
jgi:hypothetical protein